MAERYYAVTVDVVHIEPQQEFEGALFDNSCDVIIEHVEYLYTEAAKGKKITFFCAPQIHRGLKLVVPQSFDSVDELRGKTMAVRDLGRPHTITLWLRKMGLEKDVGTMIVKDKDVGRWQQWKKIIAGECAACFLSPLYLPDALVAGLKTFPAPEAEIISNFAQACLSSFAHQNPALMKDYLKAVVHAFVLLVHRRDQAMAIVAGEPMRLMKISDAGELRRQVDSIAEMLQVKPYPTVEAIMNTHEIAAHEYGAALENPLTLWDIHWLKELDDEGFIDDLVESLSGVSQRRR
jgi:ABC-type nitrate/sulfonate/bicarbonate transport systems, periplasmic components